MKLCRIAYNIRLPKIALELAAPRDGWPWAGRLAERQ